MPGPLALALDFGGTKLETALIDSDGALVPGSRHRRPTGPAATSDELAARVAEAIRASLDAMPVGAALAGAGIGAAGPVDLAEGTVSPLNVPAWRGYPLAGLVSSLVPGVPVTLRIDGLCIALAEHWIGAGQGAGNFLGMIVSTGVGGGLLLGGRAAPGTTGNGGHIGHVEVGGHDEPCACGGRGCLEAIASGPNSVAWARRHGFTGATGEDLAAAYAAGDAVARAAVERAGTALGRTIGSAANLVDLDRVAIGGGFSRVSPDLLEIARRALADRSDFGFVRRVEIVASALSDEGPLIGAGALVHRPDRI
ncbi:ROK family protein [Agromyces archimandritae]|uniref:ROK family protein n=1 Tax=Agromyces archimandritae TaxID=2781962 RepID=A0A975FNG1_9MICO|nr:ROK family protein [Agromyces archimandritae]QTX05099.1 ROK family protein [Agromyces archimandritae]